MCGKTLSAERLLASRQVATTTIESMVKCTVLCAFDIYNVKENDIVDNT